MLTTAALVNIMTLNTAITEGKVIGFTNMLTASGLWGCLCVWAIIPGLVPRLSEVLECLELLKLGDFECCFIYL